MSIIDPYNPTFAVLIIPIVGIAYTNYILAQKHPGDIRVIWYLFSLAATTSLILALWAEKYGAVDSAGKFQGAPGSLLSFLLKTSLDLESSFLFCLGIVAVILVPQVFSYVLSGLSGCASSPVFIGGTVSLFAWGLIKSLAVASGVALVIPLYGYLNNWSNATGKHALGMAILSATIIWLAFNAILFYRGMLNIPDAARRIIPDWFKHILVITNMWMKRRGQPPSQ